MTMLPTKSDRDYSSISLSWIIVLEEGNAKVVRAPTAKELREMAELMEVVEADGVQG